MTGAAPILYLDRQFRRARFYPLQFHKAKPQLQPELGTFWRYLLALSAMQNQADDISAIVHELQNKIWQKSSGDGDIVRTILKELRRADLNSDNCISMWELQYVIARYFGMELSDEQAAKLFRCVNTSGTGTVTMPEFVEFLSGSEGQGRKVRAKGSAEKARKNEIFAEGSMFAKVIAERPPKPRPKQAILKVPPATPRTNDAVVNKIIADISHKYLSRCRYDGEVVRRLNGAMRLWDRDDSGCIDEQEVGEAILDIFGYKLSDEQRHLVFEKLDQDRDGFVSKLEFIHGLTANELGRKFGNPDDFQGTDATFKHGDAPMFNWQKRGSAEDSDLMSRRISDKEFKKKTAKGQHRAIKRQQITQRPYTKNPTKLLDVIKEKIASRCTMDKNILRDVVWRLKQADESGDGNISETEMQHYVAKFFGFHLSAEQSISLFRMLDETGNGVLTREEFIRGLSGTRGAQSPWSGRKVKRKGKFAELAATSNIGATSDPHAGHTNKDFPKLDCSVQSTNIIRQMREAVAGRCHKDSKLALWVTQMMRNYDEDNDNAIDVKELQAMLRDEFRFDLTNGQTSELLDAMGTPGSGLLTKDQLVHALTNKSGHNVTYVDKNDMVVSTNTLGRAESHVYTKDDEETPRSVYPYARKATSPKRIDLRARTASGKKRMLQQMRERIEQLCSTDAEMCLLITRLVRNFDTSGKGELSITDLGRALHEQFGFDLALHAVMDVYEELNRGAQQGQPLTVERFIANLIEKTGHDHAVSRAGDAHEHDKPDSYYYYDDEKPGRDDFEPDEYVGDDKYNGQAGGNDYEDEAVGQAEDAELDQQQQELAQQQQELEEQQFELGLQRRELEVQQQQRIEDMQHEDMQYRTPQNEEKQQQTQQHMSQRPPSGVVFDDKRGEQQMEQQMPMTEQVMQYPHHQYHHQQQQQMQQMQPMQTQQQRPPSRVNTFAPQRPARPSTSRPSGRPGANGTLTVARPNTGGGQFSGRPQTGSSVGRASGGRGGRTFISSGSRIRRPQTATGFTQRPTTHDQFNQPASGTNKYQRPPSRHSARPISNTCIRIGIPNIDFNNGSRPTSAPGQALRRYQPNMAKGRPQSEAWKRQPMGQGQKGQRTGVRMPRQGLKKKQQGFGGVRGCAAGVLNKRDNSAPANFAYFPPQKRY
jgi:Ca2+-binding EF-hand superfamily protein